MFEDIIIKDEALSESYIDHLYKITTNPTFPWYFINNSANPMSKNYTGDTFSFAHLMFMDGRDLSITYHHFYPAVLQILDKFNFNSNQYKLKRLRLGLNTLVKDNVINEPHIDLQEEHKTILLYLNDSDGDTYFYEEDKKTIIQKVSPKKNRMVLFNGLIPHSSSKPTNTSHRIVLNINFTVSTNEQFIQ